MTEAVSRFVDNAGVRLHWLEYRVRADAGEAPVVFVPGMSCTAEDYRAVLPALGLWTVVVDLRGHGDSIGLAAGYTLDDHASDIDAVVRELTDGPVHLMTFSRGTCYGLAWAGQHPDRVRSIAIGDYPAREIALGADAADAFVAGRWRGRAVADRLDEDAVRKTFAQAADRPLWHVPRDLGVPLLVVRSGAEKPLTDTDWARYRTEYPAATLVEFPDATHDLFRADRTRFVALVAAHAGAADAAARRSG